jgi:hypothetical protein
MSAGKLTGDPELRYEKGEIIGKGSFGIVYKGMYQWVVSESRIIGCSCLPHFFWWDR